MAEALEPCWIQKEIEVGAVHSSGSMAKTCAIEELANLSILSHFADEGDCSNETPSNVEFHNSNWRCLTFTSKRWRGR